MQDGLTAGNVGSDDEEGCGCVVGFEDLEDLVGLFGGSVVDGEGYYFLGCWDMEEDVGVAMLKVVD